MNQQHSGRGWRLVTVGLLAAGLVAALAVGQDGAELIAAGSTWQYHDQGRDLGSAWREPGFDVAGWPAGPAPLGYGEAGLATTLSSGENPRQKPITCYFVRTFELPQVPTAGALTLLVRYDDGLVVWLNGQRLAARGLPETVAFDTVASSHEATAFETIAGLPLTALRAGTNTVAVEVHQAGPTSSDLYYDLALFLGEPRTDWVVRPYLQNLSATGVTIQWETSAPAPGRVEYGRDDLPPGQYPLVAVNDEPLDIQRVRLAELEPETRYRYRVRHAGRRFESHFVTGPGHQRPVRFVAMGDSRNWATRWEDNNFADDVLSRRVEFMLNTGDLVTNGFVREQWPGHFRRFAETDSFLTQFAVRGNHEQAYGADPARNWFNYYFEHPGGEPYSSMDWGNLHIAYISYPLERELATAEWLDRDLAATDRPWKLVSYHVPTWCTGYRTGDDSRKVTGLPHLDRVLERHGVAMVILGHTHIYERTWPLLEGRRDDQRGVPHLITGGQLGSGFPDWFTAHVLGRDAGYDYPHYSVIETYPDQMHVRSYALVSGSSPPRTEEIDRYIRWTDEAVPRARLAALESPDRWEQVEAIEDLGAMLYQPAVDRLVPLVTADAADLRLAAARALRRIGSPRTAPQVISLIAAADPGVQEELTRALEIALLPELGDQVRGLALDSSLTAEARANCLGALLRHRPDLACEVAAQCLSSGDRLVAQRAAEVYKRVVTGDQSEALLAAFVAAEDSYIKVSLAWAVARLTGQRVDYRAVGALDQAGREAQAEKWRETL